MLTLSDTRYQAKLVKRPLLTQVVTTAILFGTGDVIAQQAVDKKGLEKHDLARTGRMVLYGGGESRITYLYSPEGSMSQREPAIVLTCPLTIGKEDHMY